MNTFNQEIKRQGFKAYKSNTGFVAFSITDLSVNKDWQKIDFCLTCNNTGKISNKENCLNCN